ncbi:hypothetical protein BDV12DRAFT_180593 [Aspergillus spectabilis]
MPDGEHFAARALEILETQKDPQSYYDITSATSVRTSVYVYLHMYYVLASTPLCLHDAGAPSYA